MIQYKNKGKARDDRFKNKQIKIIWHFLTHVLETLHDDDDEGCVDLMFSKPNQSAGQHTGLKVICFVLDVALGWAQNS